MSDSLASKANACSPMRAKFLADANFDLVILAAAKRREPAFDFQTAQEAGLTSLQDPRSACRGRTRGTCPVDARCPDDATALCGVHR